MTIVYPKPPKLYDVNGRYYTAADIRTQGVGENFTVLNPEDGYRKDNRLWFGHCSECGERVTSSSIDGILWKHSVTPPSGSPTATVDVSYCPDGPIN